MISYLAPGYPAELFERIGAHIGAEVSFDTNRSGPEPDDDPFADGRADVGWICSTAFVELTTDRAPSVRELGVAWVPDDPDAVGRPVYFSDVIVTANSTASSRDDLTGAHIGCNDPASLSGYHSLRIELGRRGQTIDEVAHIEMTGGHHASLDRLIDGSLEAAVIDSVVLRTRRRADPAVTALRIVERLGPWPTQPMVVRSDMPDSDIGLIRDAVLRANDDPAVAALMRSASLTSLVRTGVDHCGPVRAAMRATAR